MKIPKVCRLTAVLALGAASLPAATLVIDNFNTVQGLTSTSSATGAVQTGADAVGGWRWASLISSATLGVNSGVLTLSQGLNSQTRLIWDGNGNSTFSDGGLAGDLSGYQEIVVSMRGTSASTFTMELYTGANRSSRSFTSPNTGTAVPFTQIVLPLNTFTGNATLSNITAFSLFGSGFAGGTTFQFDFIEARGTDVPEPSTAALMGLAGLAAVASRRRWTKSDSCR